MMRNPGWVAVALIAVALTVAACGNDSAGAAYGGYGTPVGGSTRATAAARPCRLLLRSRPSC